MALAEVLALFACCAVSTENESPWDILRKALVNPVFLEETGIPFSILMFMVSWFWLVYPYRHGRKGLSTFADAPWRAVKGAAEPFGLELVASAQPVADAGQDEAVEEEGGEGHGIGKLGLFNLLF
jgi:hypothetical protein